MLIPGYVDIILCELSIGVDYMKWLILDCIETMTEENTIETQSHPTFYQNHPLLPFISLAMILNQKILPIPSLRKIPHTNERKFLSFHPFYIENEQGTQQEQPLLPLH
jgi:hypothetical protein